MDCGLGSDSEWHVERCLTRSSFLKDRLVACIVGGATHIGGSRQVDLNLLCLEGLRDYGTRNLLFLYYFRRGARLSWEFANLPTESLRLLIFKENNKAWWQIEFAYQVVNWLVEPGAERLYYHLFYERFKRPEAESMSGGRLVIGARDV